MAACIDSAISSGKNGSRTPCTMRVGAATPDGKVGRGADQHQRLHVVRLLGHQVE